MKSRTAVPMYTTGTRLYIAGAAGVVMLLCWSQPTSGQAAEMLRPVRHDLAWRDDCLMCHRVGAIDKVPDVPQKHEGRASETCLWCHAEDSAMLTTIPSPVPHEVEQRKACTLCHTPGRIVAVPDAPADHQGRSEQFCFLCHVPERVRGR